jgi:hypothetical protein
VCLQQDTAGTRPPSCTRLAAGCRPLRRTTTFRTRVLTSPAGSSLRRFSAPISGLEPLRAPEPPSVGSRDPADGLQPFERGHPEGRRPQLASLDGYLVCRVCAPQKGALSTTNSDRRRSHGRGNCSHELLLRADTDSPRGEGPNSCQHRRKPSFSHCRDSSGASSATRPPLAAPTGEAKVAGATTGLTLCTATD